eukprot:TRINITY_DN5997_c1_g1_i1.p1 TRINITY_DN5997_c1_g1~~TRINITY_DN5997_c1_g1_i1.p1  ORF type:complete len:215 (-),score=82.13 TRINITY_DN5997_c1_g1_i1:82-726(-)
MGEVIAEICLRCFIECCLTCTAVIIADCIKNAANNNNNNQEENKSLFTEQNQKQTEEQELNIYQKEQEPQQHLIEPLKNLNSRKKINLLSINYENLLFVQWLNENQEQIEFKYETQSHLQQQYILLLNLPLSQNQQNSILQLVSSTNIISIFCWFELSNASFEQFESESSQFLQTHFNSLFSNSRIFHFKTNHYNFKFSDQNIEQLKTIIELLY